MSRFPRAIESLCARARFEQTYRIYTGSDRHLKRWAPRPGQSSAEGGTPPAITRWTKGDTATGMTRRERITRAVYGAVDDLNEQLPRSQRLVKSPETTLLGPGATLDSLGLVNLIAATQERIEEAFGARLTLADGEFLASAAQQAATLGGFIDHIETTLDTRGHA